MAKFEKYNFEGLDFMCRGWDTSRAWGHEVFVIDGAFEVAHYRVRYYNRTWEAYRFQSAMYGALDEYKRSELNRYLRNKKIELGLIEWDSETHEDIEKPFKRGQKKKLIEEFEQSELCQKIEKIKQHINEGK